ncbi:MAG: malonyl-ACP O-methyltransferase BioC [Methylococcaceae bacterium]|jgi:malonyl-CoA O-methyltransferase
MDSPIEIDKNKVRKSFSNASQTYDQAALLQQLIGKQLLKTVKGKTGHVLDLGCGTGFFTQLLIASLNPESIIAMDIAEKMVQASVVKLSYCPSFKVICADIEHLPFADHCFDIVCSNLALQWVIYLERTFSDIKRVLKPGSQLVFSTFGPKTLNELKTAWAKVDHYSHVNEFYNQDQIKQYLQDSGFKQIEINSLTYSLEYLSVLDLMQKLKLIGAHNVTSKRNKNFTTAKQIQAMMMAYEQANMQDGHVLATYEIYMVSAIA